MRPARGVLFDLDGTLADTAADLTAALNRVLADLGRDPVPLAEARIHVSRGAGALLRLGLDAAADDPRIAKWRPRFLGYYADALCVHTRLYPGIDALLDALSARAIPWGVVTNKPREYAAPLLDILAPRPAPSVLVCADDLAYKKPHPLPLRRACEVLRVAPPQCVFVGDDRRDIVAGLRAGTMTVAAAWGYIGPDEDPERWGADLIAGDAAMLAGYLAGGAPAGIGDRA